MNFYRANFWYLLIIFCSSSEAERINRLLNKWVICSPKLEVYSIYPLFKFKIKLTHSHIQTDLLFITTLLLTSIVCVGKNSDGLDLFNKNSKMSYSSLGKLMVNNVTKFHGNQLLKAGATVTRWR